MLTDSIELSSHYSEEELAQLDLQKIPNHIAIIMDGNRRWARQRGINPIAGHWEGAETLTEVLKSAADLGVKTLTVYAFSTENWNRSPEEVEDLMNIFEMYLMRKKEQMVRDGIKLGSIGDLSKLPKRVRLAFEETKKATQHCERIELLLALNYGARDEIKRAVQQIVRDKVPLEEINEESIAKYLDTSGRPDPELLIRTSGEMRVSNFLLWQISYAEIVSVQTLWPDFSSKELLKAILTYQERNRRMGK